MMKQTFDFGIRGLFLFSLLATIPNHVKGEEPFINEFHYDNASSDVNEGVEIAGVAGTDLTAYSLVFYNGNNNLQYDTENLSGTIPDEEGSGFGAVWFPVAGIQNGGSDGIALVKCGTDVLEFLSYEGSLTAEDGPAVGITSTDIGVSEPGSTLITQSLQLKGTGCVSSDFTWTSPSTSSSGNINAGQTFSGCGTPSPPDACPKEEVLIEDIQGDGFQSSMIGEAVFIVDAVVTQIFSNGFTIQQENTQPTKSSGIFVFSTDDGILGSISEGDILSLEGTVSEFETSGGASSQTQITNPDITDNQPGAVIAPTPLVLPTASLEAFEGMLVSVQADTGNDMVVSEYFNLDRFGEFKVCSAPVADGRIFQFTARNVPDVTGYTAFQDLFERSCISIDDGNSSQNPDPLLLGGLDEYEVTTENTLRGGAKVTTMVGVVQDLFGDYKIVPRTVADLVFEDQFLGRPEADDFPMTLSNDLDKEEIRVVSTNLLNYFVSLDGCNGIYRGADNLGEFYRQQEKMITALSILDADIFGVVEVENSPNNYNVAVFDVVTNLNQVAAERRKLTPNDDVRDYTAVSLEAGLSAIGGDAIKVDIIYDKNKLSLEGYATLTDEDIIDQSLLDQATEDNCIFNCRSRVPLAATFELKGNRAITVAVNHFKSKGPSGVSSSSPEADQGDGAGNWNNLRTLSSQALLEWIDTNPTGYETENILLMGDFNAYAKEPPITTIVDAGYTDVEVEFADSEYSYVFSGQWGALDYIFVSPSLGSGIFSASTWHVNADEPDYLDYNTDFGRNQDVFDGNKPYRFSDHDPLVAELVVPKASKAGRRGTRRLKKLKERTN